MNLRRDAQMRSLHIYSDSEPVALIKKRTLFGSRLIPINEVWIKDKVFMETVLQFPKVKEVKSGNVP